MSRRDHAIPIVPGQRLGRFVVVGLERKDPHFGAMVRARRDDGLEVVRSIASLRYQAHKTEDPAWTARPRDEDRGGLTLDQCAEILRLSPARVAQIERRALEKLRLLLSGTDWADGRTT